VVAIRPKVARARAGAVLLGPAFVAAIAHVDPGNVATNTAAGARYGYLLVRVLVVAMATDLAEVLGEVGGRDRPQPRAGLPRVLSSSRPTRRGPW
jgi:manganese transport protein